MAPVDGVETSVQRMYGEYIEAFNARDVDALVDFYLHPYMEMGAPGGGRTIFADVEASRVHFEGGLRQLIDAGWSETEIERSSATRLADDVALLQVRVARLKGDGGSLGSTDVVYTTVLDEGRWRFASYVYMAEDAVGIAPE